MMILRPQSIMVAFACCALAQTALALEWRQTTQQAQAEPFQKTVTLTFDFKNTGDKPVHLLDIQTSCTCLSAQSTTKRCEPGQSGQIQAQFSAEEPPGVYERHLSVLTDESPTPQRLTLQIEVPELAILTPRSIEWQLQETAAEKNSELRANGTLKIDFTRAVPSNDSFTARLETVESGRAYKLIIQPRRTDSIANAAIRVYGRDDAGHEILISAYANVR